jgi:hypothetical protein
MTTERDPARRPGPQWDADFARRSPMFAPLRPYADRLPRLGWPNTEVLDVLAQDSGRRIVNARGQRIRFVSPPSDNAQEYEQRVHASGEIAVRPVNWHDLLNALVWMAFPTSKAALNARHCATIDTHTHGARSPTRDALTHFDEDGVVVLCADPELSALLARFAWKELFWVRRDAVRRAMRFWLFGHALYDKARSPFLGMTGKAIVFDVPAAALAQDARKLTHDADRQTALHLLDPARMLSPRVLWPLPVLGVPGWWDANEAAEFYDNAGYFRPGRRH